MPKGSYGFSLLKTETSRRDQLLLLFTSSQYFPENTSVLLTDLMETTLNHTEQTDLTLNPEKIVQEDLSLRQLLGSPSYLTKILLVVAQTHILILFFGEM